MCFVILSQNLITKICLYHQADERVRQVADVIRISGDLGM